jgi:putative membrane protein
VTHRPFDAGLQNERTALAWTRTALALLAAVFLAARITVAQLGAFTVVITAVTLPLATAVLAAASRRYRAAHRALHTRAALPDGRLPAAVTALVIALAVIELAYVHTR